MSDKLDEEVTAIQREFLEQHRTNYRLIIVETKEGWEVHNHTVDGVAPPTKYPNKRLAASRMLQMLGIGPVAPQTHPEEVCIGEITTAPTP